MRRQGRLAPSRAYRLTLVPLPLLVRQPGLEGPDLDEAGGGGLGEELFAGLGEAGELGVVDGVRGGAGHDADAAFVEAEADLARYAGVDGAHVGVEVFAQRLPPEAGVDEVAPLLVHRGLELVLVDRADQ